MMTGRRPRSPRRRARLPCPLARLPLSPLPLRPRLPRLRLPLLLPEVM